MTGLAIAGFLLSALPLVLALLFAELALERISAQTETLLDDSVAVTRLGEQQFQQLGDIERGARQYAALRDDDLGEILDKRWQVAEELLQQQNIAAIDPAIGAAVAELARDERDARQAWSVALVDARTMNAAIDKIRNLRPQAGAVIAASREHLDARLKRLADATRHARQEMLLSTATLVPLGALLVLGFSVVVTRPIKHMFRAIAALGRGRYERAIAIPYPQEMRRLGEQIDWLRRRLAHFEQDKDRFLRQVSHELKTPLVSLREGTDLLREGSLGELSRQQREITEILAESTGELEQLINNLLSYAEWRAERTQAQRIWFEARALIEEVAAVNRLSMAKRGLSMELELGAQRLFGLRSQLRVAFDNLVTNAIKHSPHGGVIEIGTRVADGFFELSVRDHGRGVSEAEKGTIFEPFVRGVEAEEEGIRGTGVGLSIVRETALAHGGGVRVGDAQPGACFTLAWPVPGFQLGDERLRADSLAAEWQPAA